VTGFKRANRRTVRDNLTTTKIQCLQPAQREAKIKDGKIASHNFIFQPLM